MTTAGETYLIRCPSCGTANRVPASSEGKTGKCGNCHDSLPPLYRHPLELTDRTFGEFTAGHKGLVLAEFWAPW